MTSAPAAGDPRVVDKEQDPTALRTETEAPAAWGGYALRWERWQYGAVALELATVANLASLVDTEALLRDAHAPEPPYWAHLWPGSRALARYVVEHPEVVSGRCLEVGCGLGLVALVLARMGGEVFAFDRNRDAVGFCQLNARRNGLHIHAWQGDARQFVVRGRFPLICAADVTYDASLQQAVLELAERGLAGDGRVLCAESVRVFDRAWLEEARGRGFSVREEELEEVECGRPVQVRLLELRRVRSDTV